MSWFWLNRSSGCVVAPITSFTGISNGLLPKLPRTSTAPSNKPGERFVVLTPITKAAGVVADGVETVIHWLDTPTGATVIDAGLPKFEAINVCRGGCAPPC